MSGKVHKGIGAAIAAIVASVFLFEGGYVNNPKDPGGATNHGITERVARANGFEGDMRNLPKSKAEEIYIKDYISKPGYKEIIAISPAVGHKLVDAGVNTGTSRSSRWFQQSLNAVNRGGKDYPNVVISGSVDFTTVAAYKALSNKRGKVEACKMILKMMDAHQTMHYLSLKKQDTFTPGWIINRIGNVPLEECNETVI